MNLPLRKWGRFFKVIYLSSLLWLRVEYYLSIDMINGTFRGKTSFEN